MHRFKVTVVNADTGEYGVFYVRASDRTRAGISARTLYAEGLGEEYDPDIHKVLDVIALDKPDSV